MSSSKTPTPFMRQWERAKSAHPDALLLFRMGDFYELFGEDARVVSRECELTLTSRDKGKEDALPMCGVPHHACERHIATLLSRGFRVAVCEQMEDPKYARGLVKREVVRVLSPGTVLEDSYLQGVGARAGNNFLAAVCANASLSRFGLALVDVSTGEFLAGEVAARSGAQSDQESAANSNARSDGIGDENGEAARICEAPSPEPSLGLDVTPNDPELQARFGPLREELLRYAPAEVLVPQALRECPGFLAALEALEVRTTAHDVSGFDAPRDRLLRQFKTSSLRGFGLEEAPLAQEAAAACLDYLAASHLSALGHLRRISLLSNDHVMLLDSATRRNLELAQSIRDGSSKGTLVALLDGTRTGAGSRLLRKWVLSPLLSRERIERRQSAVEELRADLLLRRDCRELLRGIGDIERLVSRCVAGSASPRDLVALRGALQTLPTLEGALAGVTSAALVNVRQHLDPASQLREHLEAALADEPPALASEGGLIREGFDAGLDELREAARDGRVWMTALEESERARTGIASLKVGFNNVFGYYIEVTKANLARVPDSYTRKQTTTNAERFITPELKEREELILGAQDKSRELERRLFEAARERVAAQAAPLLDTARALAHLDVFAALAEVAATRDYVRPQIEDEPILEIRSGRHPVVEAAQEVPFVPNDALLDPTDQGVIIITGPNASGKSTFLRQVALIALMAQIGSFVPARSARIGIIDRIFTRVGAQDDLATGQSTFTVEMNETANILNNATPRSLVILDEVGRGTSTYDGLSIAWAVAEHLHELGPKTLFATHYHHLNELEGRLPRVRNYRIAVKEDGEQIIFLRRIVRGGTDRSFGIQVARLAGLPPAVIKRASQLLELFSRERLRGDAETEAAPVPAPVPTIATPSLFDALASETTGPEAQAPDPIGEALREQLRALDPDNLTPLEALVQLQELRKLALS